jgi:hypothetical protein
MPYDCTFVVPTVGPSSNQVYDEVVAAILINQSLLLIFSTITDPAAQPDNATEEMDDTDGTMGTPLPSSVWGASAFTFCGHFSGQVSVEAQSSTSKPCFPISLDRQATLSWFVFTLKIKIKGTFTLLLY